MLGQMRRDQPVCGFTFGRHRAALGVGDGLCRHFEAADLFVAETVFAKTQRTNQCPMHDQVSVAADRRGEVGVFGQMQAEMAVVLGVVLGLAL